jgi:UDP-glucose 4-epimerase
MPLLPLSPYALHKEIGERYCRQYHEIYDLATVALRFFNVYGPGQDPSSGYAAAIPRFAAQLAGGEQPTVFGDGLQTRDFVFVSDVVAACRSAAAAPEPALGRVINIASGEQTSVLEVLTQLKQVLDCDKIEPLMGAPRDGDVRHSVADVALAAELLDWRPAVALGEGIEVTTRALEGAT